METLFYYGSIALVIACFIFSAFYKKLLLPSIIIGIASVGYSLIYELIFGLLLSLYYYIAPRDSLPLILLASVFLYPLLNMIYTIFLPDDKKKALIYTGCWVALMMIFEYVSILTKTLVLTGWQPMPWSVITYVFTYLWVYYFHRYLLSRLKQANPG